jgi:hypothetical protein
MSRSRIRSKAAAAAIAGAVVAVLCPIMGFAEENAAPAPKFGSLAKSLLVPGWGQIAEKRYLEGAVFLGAEIVCVIGILRNNRLGNESYDLYKTAASAEDAVRFRQATETADGRRNKFILAAAAVWTVNLLDIYFIVRNREAGRRAVALRITHDAPRQIGLSLSCRF